jgi:hypothetical protein
MRFIIASPAERLIDIFFAQQNLPGFVRFPERILCKVTASCAYCMHFGNVLGNCKECRHGTKRAPHEIHIEACHNNPYTVVSKAVANINYRTVKKLSLINPHYIAIVCQEKYGGGIFDRC